MTNVLIEFKPSCNKIADFFQDNLFRLFPFTKQNTTIKFSSNLNTQRKSGCD